VGITADGERSRSRMWFGKKLAYVLRMTEGLSKVLKWQGFTFRVSLLGDMIQGRITAPMGGVALYTCVHGTQVMTADYWMDVFTPPRYMYAMYGNYPDGAYGFRGVHYVPEEDLISDGYTTIQHVPMVTSSPYYASNPPRPDGAGAPDTWEFDAMPTPVTMPAMGSEAFYTNMNASVYVSGNPIDRSLVDTNLTFYTARGINLANRLSFSFEEASVKGTAHIHTLLPAKEMSAFRYNGQEYQFFDVDAMGVDARVVGIWYLMQFSELFLYYIELSTIVQNMPFCLQTAVIEPATSSVRPAGNYAFTDSVDGYPIVFTAVDLTNTVMGGMPTAPEEACFTATPADEKWRLSLHINYSGTGVVHSVDSSQFLPLLDSLSTHPDITPLTSWADALYMLQQFFPRPNHNFAVPHDSVMFHDENNEICVWTRKYGAVKFTETGMHVTSLNIPVEATGTDGVRPTITYSGDGMYLCVCETLETPLRVHSIYYGSPFGSWTSVVIPAVEVGVLVNVRPVSVTSDSIILLGVIEDVDGLYYFSFLYVKDDVGTWSRMGKLSVTRPDSPYLGRLVCLVKGKFLKCYLNIHLSQLACNKCQLVLTQDMQGECHR